MKLDDLNSRISYDLRKRMPKARFPVSYPDRSPEPQILERYSHNYY